MDSIKAAVEPLPFVPLTCMVLIPRCGFPKYSKSKDGEYLIVFLKFDDLRYLPFNNRWFKYSWNKGSYSDGSIYNSFDVYDVKTGLIQWWGNKKTHSKQSLFQDVINNKTQDYYNARKDNDQAHECYYQIFMHIIGGNSRIDLEKELKRKESGLELMYGNDDFSSMIPQYKNTIKVLKEKIIGFDLAEIMIPHMIRTARQKLRNINLKKIKSLSKKIAKESV